MGGNVAASMIAVGLAFFFSDVNTILSFDCWNILANVRAPFIKSFIMMMSSMNDKSKKQDQQQQQTKSSGLSTQGMSIVMKLVASVLYILSPALASAKNVVFDDFENLFKKDNGDIQDNDGTFSSSSSSNPIYDACIERVKKAAENKSGIFANCSSPPNFETIMSQTLREFASPTSVFSSLSGTQQQQDGNNNNSGNFGKNLSQMKDVVESDYCCNVGNSNTGSSRMRR